MFRIARVYCLGGRGGKWQKLLYFYLFAGRKEGRKDLLAPKKGLTTPLFSKLFHSNQIPLSMEYTNLLHFFSPVNLINPFNGYRGVRLKADAMPPKNLDTIGD